MLSLAHRILALTLIVAALVLLPRVGSAGPQHHEPEHPPADKRAPEHGGKDAHHEDHGEHGAHKEMTAQDHVSDSDEFHLFSSIWPHSIHLPNIFGFQITKFMVLELIAAGLILIFYIPLAIRARSGQPVRGWYWNMFEVLLTFVRNEIAKPNLGEDKADRYLPFLWTLFLFILFNNLLGMFPGLGSATASIYVTGAMAVIVFFAIHGSAILSMGSSAGGHGHGDHGHDHAHHDHAHAVHGHTAHAEAPANPALVVGRGSWRYLQSLWPHIDVPIPVVGLVIKVLVFLIEIVGILVRNAVLAVRLFANMFAGHMVLATILLFITMAANAHWALWSTITISSVLGIVALSLLELFVAFLQAYIFTFLASLFMGMAINPQH